MISASVVGSRGQGLARPEGLCQGHTAPPLCPHVDCMHSAHTVCPGPRDGVDGAEGPRHGFHTAAPAPHLADGRAPNARGPGWDEGDCDPQVRPVLDF